MAGTVGPPTAGTTSPLRALGWCQGTEWYGGGSAGLQNANTSNSAKPEFDSRYNSAGLVWRKASRSGQELVGKKEGRGKGKGERGRGKRAKWTGHPHRLPHLQSIWPTAGLLGLLGLEPVMLPPPRLPKGVVWLATRSRIAADCRLSTRSRNATVGKVHQSLSALPARTTKASSMDGDGPRSMVRWRRSFNCQLTAHLQATLPLAPNRPIRRWRHPAALESTTTMYCTSTSSRLSQQQSCQTT